MKRFAFVILFVALLSLTHAPHKSTAQGTGGPAQTVPNLSGQWKDGDSLIRLTHAPGTGYIYAEYNESHPCDPQDGSPLQYTDWDFSGTLSGNQLQGETHTCGYGKGNPRLGINKATLKLTASADDRTLSGTWYDVEANNNKGADRPITITKVSCTNFFNIAPGVQSHDAEFPDSPGDLIPCDNCAGKSLWLLVRVESDSHKDEVIDNQRKPGVEYLLTTSRYIATWQCPDGRITVREEKHVRVPNSMLRK